MNQKLNKLSQLILELEQQKKEYYNQMSDLEDKIEQINLRLDDVHNEMEFEYQLHKEQNN